MAVSQQDSAINPLIAIQTEMSRSNDFTSASKLDDLIEKSISREKQIAFTGHFSAGKSTLLNTLLEEEILPASPIPTSANLVYIRRGKKRIMLDTHAGEQVEANPDMELEELQQYAKEGDEIAKIHIWKPSQLLPEAVALIDTPGVDSNDASHMESTVSALHAADFIFYVTDYNHVQSEGTIEFLKRLIEDGQEAALIVNQIDKHREEELPFSQFKARIEESFQEIGLMSSRIFYTTMKDLNHPDNELDQVKKTVEEQLSDRDKRSESAQGKLVIQAHIRFLENQEGVRTEEKTAAEDQWKRLSEELQAIQNQSEMKKQRITNVWTNAKAEIAKILANANITPFEMREQAKLYVEAMKPGFKAGLFFAKKKTGEEISKRTEDFSAVLNELVSSQIDWHVKDILSKTVRALELQDSDADGEISSYAAEGLMNIANGSLQNGADATPEYVMNYTKAIAENVKNASRKQAQTILDSIMDKALRNSFDNEQLQLHKHLQDEMNETDEKLLKIIKIIEQREYLLKILRHEVPAEADEKEWQLRKKSRTSISQAPVNGKRKEQEQIDNRSVKERLPESASVNTERVIEHAEAMADLAGRIKGFEGRQRLIREKSSRLKDRTFTIALFGAFSAGKSSAANALLGGKVLPSSPNPTTAAINRIVPVTNEHVHGSVAVKRKSVQKLVTEIKEIYPEIPFEGNQYSELLDAIARALSDSGLNDSQKTVLTMYSEGLKWNEWGEEAVHWTDLDHFAPYVSEENLAILTEEAVIYYDCPLTRRGITLVDTPGADSLNKRHTNVAFQFIKQSDALLYVTYYNHPFSKGDREFIQQLGRVKDSFSLDKMFFLINAIDLAKSNQEVDLVKDYIESQFLEEGVRSPRMYGISSLHELAGIPMDVQSDYPLFKKDLAAFIEKDLVQTAVSSLKGEMNGLLRQLSSYIEETDKSEEEKEAALNQRKQELSEAVHYLNTESCENFIKRVNQEITEQFYYLIQRMGLQFPEMFREHFHPGVFNQDGSAKTILHVQMDELIQAADYRLVQELQAITLRCENTLKQQLINMAEKLSEGLFAIMKLEGLTAPEFQPIDTPAVSAVLTHSASAYQRELSMFSNTKAFFEKNERTKMSGAVWEAMQKEISSRLSEREQEFAEFYRSRLTEMAGVLTKKLRMDAENYFSGLLELYQDNRSADILKTAYKECTELYEAL
ncbi:dynamin family protein [Metabacillus sp. KIGAM252]|uniref:Dynamin family protein n=1 Tax=Metabacillus flavus TaxID=2823519 RepID=A0ABS5LF29_9BACI|nr:dynamin family protein [Metabacillus flavus]MBS2969345.1 dynamin family protein [Metabacillus flavus]